MKILLDTCVFVDMLLVRENPLDNEAALMILRLSSNPKLEFCVSPVTIATSFYLLRKNQNAAEKIKECLKNIAVVTASSNDVKYSLVFDYPDREDALQMSCACNADCELILTRNPSHFANAPLPFMTPSDFIKKIRI